MGQVESTIFDDAPPWDMKMILKLTQLQEEEVNFCWKKWATNPSTKKGKIDSEAFKELFEIADDDDKGGLISKSFSFWLKSPKKGAKIYPEHYSPIEKMLKIVIWNLLGEIWAKVKNFLRISNL
jgi:hypothetical protein